jgi:hypothetical protein
VRVSCLIDCPFAPRSRVWRPSPPIAMGGLQNMLHANGKCSGSGLQTLAKPPGATVMALFSPPDWLLLPGADAATSNLSSSIPVRSRAASPALPPGSSTVVGTQVAADGATKHPLVRCGPAASVSRPGRPDRPARGQRLARLSGSERSSVCNALSYCARRNCATLKAFRTGPSA